MRSIRGALLFSALVLLGQLCLSAGIVTLAWDPSTDSDVAGTQIYYGSPPGNFSAVIDMGNATNFTFVDLEPGKSYAFYIVHYNEAGLESERSNVIEYPNATPVAYAQTVKVHREVILTLVGSDPPFNDITYSIQSPPGHGTLAGSPPQVTYYPNAGYLGIDSFTFSVNDGATTSQPATVILDVYNTVPLIAPQSFSVINDDPSIISLQDTDAEGDALTISIVSPPSHGLLTRIPPYYLYTPKAGYLGTDSFSYTGNDGYADSPPAVVQIQVRVNRSPSADSQTLSVTNRTLKILLTGNDPDGDSLIFTVVETPAHGTLTNTPPKLSYIPEPLYNGPDSFMFKVNDGFVDSLPATVNLNLVRLYQQPQAASQTLAAVSGSPREVRLTGSDPDGDPLTFGVVDLPTHGILTGTPPNLIYTPTSGYSGLDSFTFKANDGFTDSLPATVNFEIRLNKEPIAESQTLTATNGARGVILTGSDPDGDPLTFKLVGLPTHGIVTGTPPNLTYTPGRRYSGPDSLTFRVNDGFADSLAAAVRFDVVRLYRPPLAYSQTLFLTNGPRAVLLTGSDPDGDPLTFGVVELPTHGTLIGSPPNLIYAPTSGYAGLDSFTFRVNDGFADSLAGTIQLRVFATVAGRHIFYNNSAFDGNNATANAADDGAIARDKTALMPGRTATFANYTSYSRGMNGIMVDIAGLKGVPTNTDFTFKVGNVGSPTDWLDAPAPAITVRSGAGVRGSDRVTIIWPDNAIENQWLQVTVQATSATGLESPDVFYFGNAIGDSGDSPTNTRVNATDEINARNNPRANGQAPVDFRYDYNRDSKVNATDEIIARNHATSSLTALQLINVPSVSLSPVVAENTGREDLARSLFVRPRIISVSLHDDGTVRVRFTGLPSGTCRIQSLADLNVGEWSDLLPQLVVIETNGVSEFIDADVTNHRTRFYRVIVK